MDKMLAVTFHGIGDVRAGQADKAAAGPGQALVKIIYGGVCGSDLHIYREGMFVSRLGEIMGHEFVGRIVEAPETSGFRQGDLVVGDPRVPCGKCLACQAEDFHRCSALGFIGEVSPGGFGEYLAIDVEKLVKLDPEVDPVQGAVAEPLAVAVHACRRIAQSGHRNAMVIGAGPIGLLIVYLLKSEFAFERVAVADIDSFRLGRARTIGADLTVESAGLAAGTFDCIVDAVGIEATLGAALEALRPGGSLYISAIYEQLPLVDINLVVGKELTVMGNNAYTREDLEEAARLLGQDRLDFSWLVTRILPAREAASAFQLLTARKKNDLKILLEF